jgi:hypothetical protein
MLNKEQNQEQRKTQAQTNKPKEQTTLATLMQNEGQQLRTTSSTKNEFKHRESHQGTKNKPFIRIK